MKGDQQNIFPQSDWFLSRKDKEILLHQRSKAIWLTGLSGSGKSTIANHLEKKLYQEGFVTKIFDGDTVRSTLTKDLDFTYEGRMQNIKRIAQINKEFLECGIIIINSFISPAKAMRMMASEIIGKDDFLEVYVKCPLHLCEKRDTKKLYSQARKGKIKNFTGINSFYEAPENPEIVIDNEKGTIDEAVAIIYNYILPKIRLNEPV